MENSFKEVLMHRRSYYALSNKKIVADEQIEEVVKFALEYVPSAFNSQTTRLVLLLGEEHKKLWKIVEDTLREIVAKEFFHKTEEKIKKGFASGYGTVLFYEDESIVKEMQENNPLYSDNFPIWMHHTTGMHQLTVWSMLEDLGFGASLQHYNPLIDERVRKTWNLPEDWKLIAQMPFGFPIEEPGKKEMEPLKKRMKVFM